MFLLCFTLITPWAWRMAGIKRRHLDHKDRQRRAITLGELRAQGVAVFCWCNRCSHNATVPTLQLLREMGPGTAVPEVGARLRCSGCGSKDIATRPDWPSLGQVTRHN